MIESVITLLIYICVLALVVYLVIWVLGAIGVPIPAMVLKIVWIIFALMCLLMVLRLLPLGHGRLFSQLSQIMIS
jgi:hypothetical protein